MKREFEELPNWVFDVDETSPGVYNIKGREERFGCSLNLTGTDLEKLLQQAKETALGMNQQARRKVN